MYKLTDSLALADVLGMMDGSLSLSTVTALFDTASSTPANSLEKILDALRKAVSNNTTPTAVGDAENSAASRVDFHSKLAELRNAILAVGDNRYPIATLVNKSADGLFGLARHDDIDALAYRYALKELNPFAILGLDYSRFNANGELNLFNPVTGQGGLTDEYLADRAAFLTWKNHLALRDRSAAAAPYTDAPDAFFRDYATSLTIHLGATTTDSTAKPRYLFGADQASGIEMIEGGTNADRIYGGGGADILKGQGGADYLEGNGGDDTLHGVSGNGEWKMEACAANDCAWRITA